MPKLKPLEHWICDTCSEAILEPNHGYVEWRSGYGTGEGAHSFRIVHHAPRSPRYAKGGTCYQFNDALDQSTLELPHFLGPHGVVLLLSLVDVGLHHDPNRKERPAKDLREWANVFRRLQLPYYEEARRYWSRATNEGYFEDLNEIAIYQSARMRKMIEYYERDDS